MTSSSCCGVAATTPRRRCRTPTRSTRSSTIPTTPTSPPGRIVEQGTPEALAREAGGKRTVSWIEDSAERTERTTAPTAVVRRLAERLAGPDGEVPGLQVRTPTLEDHYLDLISRHHAA